MILSSSGLARSRDKSKPFYFHYHNAYGHKTWQDCDLSWAAFTDKVSWSYNYVVWWDSMTNGKHYIFTSKMSVATKLDRIVTYLKWLLSIKSHYHIITCSCEITWQTTIITKFADPPYWEFSKSGKPIPNSEFLDTAGRRIRRRRKRRTQATASRYAFHTNAIIYFTFHNL